MAILHRTFCLRGLCALLALTLSPLLHAQSAEPGEDTDAAREALQQQEGDVTQESALEEVFQASEKQYSLLRRGRFSLYWSADYSYYRYNTIDVGFDDDYYISRFRIENDAEHAFTSALSLDYGFRDNLTLNLYLPLVYKFDSERDASSAALGDVSFGIRYQPFPVRPGGVSTTLWATLSTATGDSPYETNVQKDVSTGKGYYSVAGGVSLSRIIDPVVLFGSVGYSMPFDVGGLHQRRGTDILKEVEPGDSVSFSLGLAYALSYEVSVSASVQNSYSFSSRFRMERGGVDIWGRSKDTLSSVLNTSLGLRLRSNRILNVNFGFGLSEDSPDLLLGVSMPIQFAGLRQAR